MKTHQQQAFPLRSAAGLRKRRQERAHSLNGSGLLLRCERRQASPDVRHKQPDDQRSYRNWVQGTTRGTPRQGTSDDKAATRQPRSNLKCHSGGKVAHISRAVRT